MGALGSDAAIETADVVLMTDSPLKIVEAIKIAKQTRTVVWQNIVLALSIKGLFVVLGAIGMASMWEAVFADMGVSLAAVVNSTRALREKSLRQGDAESKKRSKLGLLVHWINSRPWARWPCCLSGACPTGFYMPRFGLPPGPCSMSSATK
jgi:hypothetical protein